MNKGINKEYIDPAISPGEDFYQFVNGGWMKSVEIPSDRSSWGSFHELAKKTDQKVLDILSGELAIKGPAKNKAARLFESGMNTVQIERKKLGGLDTFIAEIKSISDKASLTGLLGFFMTRGLSSILHFSVHPDLGNSKIYSAYLEPGTLGLPERDFYLDTDDKATLVREKYKEYVQYILKEEAGYSLEDAAFWTGKILSFETGLAVHMLSKEERRQIDKLYNPHTYQDLLTSYPDIPWNTFFNAMQIPPPERLVVTEPQFMLSLNKLFENIPLEIIRHYLTFMSIHHAAPFAHSALEIKHFELYSKTLEGTEVMRPRNERLLQVVNAFLGEALGELFVSTYFPASAKDTALEMVSDIVQAFRNRIMQLQWMSEDTKAYALEKLDAFRVKIGYPDVWKEYTELELSRSDEDGSYLEDMINVARWKFKRDADRISTEVDTSEWFMAPQVVNAYYNPMFNEIVFPAAILQPPFFDWQADAAVNYGGIGAVIGHEITHGFDDQGSRFDKEGNLNEWWTAEDRVKFSELTRQLIQQFDNYYPFEDLALNGTFTLGENIADLGGLSVAYDALQLYYARHGKPEPIDGFTAEQRFFMSWATVWRTKIRPEALRNQIKIDPHPPGMYRAVAAPSNLDSFYKAFDISQASPWYRKEEERIKIW